MRDGSAMIITTTETLVGLPVSSYLGIVTGEAIVGASIFRDFVDDMRNISEARTAGYEQELVAAKDRAMNKMRLRAQEMEADAVIGVDLDYQSIGGETRNMWMVVVNGTAVALAP